MTLFDLVFIVSLLATVGLVVRALVQLLRGRSERAARTGLGLAAFLAIYALVLVTVSLASSGDVVPIGEEQRFDDWAIAVTNVERVDRIGDTAPDGAFWIVSVRVASHARRRRQRETDVHTYLLDGRGRRYEVSPRGQAALERANLAGPPLTSILDPGGSFESKVAFDVARDAEGVAFVKQNHAWFPGLFIIGEPASFLHRPTRVLLAGHEADAVE
ncbi:MAG: hypothetical protein ACM3JJ_10070 [Hyphomicrobiales bacterium]